MEAAINFLPGLASNMDVEIEVRYTAGKCCLQSRADETKRLIFSDTIPRIVVRTYLWQ